MKYLLSLLLLGAGAMLPTVRGSEPFLDWNFATGFKDAKQQRMISVYDLSNRNLDSNKFLTRTEGAAAVKLDGKSYLRSVFRATGNQSYRLKVKFTTTPKGALVSRNRASDGLRGIECGLAKSNFFNFNGSYPAAMVSAGDRKTINSIFNPKSHSLKPGRWYDVFMIFSAGKELRLVVIDLTQKKAVFSGSVLCTNVPQLSANAGEKLLSIGARRFHSKTAGMAVPAGTLISRVTVWRKALQPEAIAKLTGTKLPETIKRTSAAMTWQVAAGAKEGGNGSVAAPFASVQQALDQVQPGDTVIIGPGVYFEQPVLRRTGTAKAPITIRADRVEQRRVVITSADPEIRRGKVKWQLEDAALKLYSVPFTHTPARVLYSGTDLMPYFSVDSLKKFTLLKNYPGPLHGFCFDPKAGKLYVRLRADGRYGSPDPNKHIMAIGAPNAPGFNGHHIWKTEHAAMHLTARTDSYVVVDGLTFEVPGAAGLLTSGGKVTVKNCFFDGCRFGVFGNKADNVVIENCFYHQYPAFDDMADVIERFRDDPNVNKTIYWWHRKGVNNDKKIMKNYETGIAGGIRSDWIIRRNVIRNAFEGLSCWGNSDSVNLQVYGNVFDKLVDNALEAENHARNMTIHDNVFKDVFEPISWQPLGGMPWPGPVFVYRNIFYNTPETQKLWPWTPGCFKIGVSGRNWEHKEMGSAPISQLKTRISKRFVMVPYPGFLVFNNTIYFPHGYLLTTPQPVVGKAARELVNFKFFNNIITVKSMHKRSEYGGSLIEFFNNICVTPAVNQQTKLMAGADGFNFDTLAAAGLKDPTGYNFALKASSPAIGHGTLLIDKSNALKDIGAVPAGKQWQMETVGPCSADGSPVKIILGPAAK